MKKIYLTSLIMLMLSATAYAAEPSISIAKEPSQRTDGSKVVDIYYDLSGDITGYIVVVFYSFDNGTSYTKALSVTGDTGKNVIAGNGKHIEWDIGADVPDTESGCRIKVAIIHPWDGIEKNYVIVPSGSFRMGDISGDGNDIERPVHSVTISSFEMSTYEVTQEQYESVMGVNPSSFSGTNLPVEQISWFDAVIFCNALSEAAGLTPCYNESDWLCNFSAEGFRLPTEAEWEYACRAGTETKYHTGDSESDLGSAGWYSSNSSLPTHPVGQKTANDFGLYDMHGNVWEWCNDWYGNEYYDSSPSGDPTGPLLGSSRVVRGGSALFDAFNCRSADRFGLDPTNSDVHFGFRVVRRPLDAIDKYSIFGKIVDSEGTGLADFTVTMGDNVVKTDDNGVYAFVVETDGIYSPSFTKSGYTFIPSSVSVSVSGSDVTVHDVTAYPPHPWKLFVTYATIPSGSFLMGDISGDGTIFERPVHSVYISSFEMSTYEVTQEQYESVMGVNPSSFSGTNLPVEQVSWFDAVIFCNALSEAAGLTPCYNESDWLCNFDADGFRLPTEAEWEYACRAGTETKYHSGDSESDLGSAGWYYYNSEGSTHPVGQKEPNAWELYDMHGNVWEWCNDIYNEYYYNTEPPYKDPTGPTSGGYRAGRGGGVKYSSGSCRSSSRGGNSPTFTFNSTGFRVVRRSEIATPPLRDDIGLTFFSIPATTIPYEMASGYTVTLSGYLMGATEVTNSQYVEFLNSTLASGDIEIQSGDVYGKNGDWAGEQYLDIGFVYNSDNRCWIFYNGDTFSLTSGKENWPVVAVSWYGAKAFAEYYGFDLPTEAEWQYGASGGRNYEYGTDDGTISDTKANYNNNIGIPNVVASYPSNPFGLFDMSGNVTEWCSDWHGNYPIGSADNPTGASTDSNRVYRGGSWNLDATYCQSAYRGHVPPDFRHGNMGFRVVLRYTLPPALVTSIDIIDGQVFDSRTVTISWHGNHIAIDFQYTFDGLEYEAITDSTVTFTDLDEGEHTFSVFGRNDRQEPGTAITRLFTVDLDAPIITSIDIIDGQVFDSRTVTISWHGNHTAIDFQYTFDGLEYEAITDSTATFTDLDEGDHTFSVLGRNDRQEPGEAITRLFTVDLDDNVDFLIIDHNKDKTYFSEYSTQMISESNFGTLSVEEMKNYSVIYFEPDWSSYSNLTKNMTNLTDFVQDGGIAVINIAGNSGNASNIDPEGTDYDRSSTYNSETILLNNHPYITGEGYNGHFLTTSEFNSWGSTDHGYLTGFPMECEKVLENSSGISWLQYALGHGYVIVTTLTYGWGGSGGRGDALENLVDYSVFLAF